VEEKRLAESSYPECPKVRGADTAAPSPSFGARTARAALASTAAVLMLTLWAPSALGSTTVGLPVEAMIGNPGANGCVAGIQCTYYQGAGALFDRVAPAYTSPIDGMIVRWRLGVGSTGNKVRLRVLSPGGAAFTGSGKGPLLTATSGINTFENERLPIKAGATIAVDNADSALLFATPGREIAVVEYFQPFLPEGGTPLAPGGELSPERLELDADVVGLPSSTGVAAACPGGSRVKVTVTADPDPTDRSKAVRFRIDGGGEQSVATSGSPGVATIAVPAGVHAVAFRGEDLLGQRESAAHVLSAGCPLPGGVPRSGGGSGPPVVGDAHQSNERWREGTALAKISAAVGAKARLPIGTAFSFTLNEAARVTLTFTQRVRGRKVGRACVAPSPRKKGRGCTRTVVRGVLAFAGHAGADTVRFQGRLSRRRKLKPGRYAVAIVATSATGARSAPASLRFTIVGG
jgi:hypothetical protein